MAGLRRPYKPVYPISFIHDFARDQWTTAGGPVRVDAETLEKSFQDGECPVCAHYFGLPEIPLERKPSGALVCHYRHSFKEDHDH